jgi:hypothetical protein
MLLKNGRPTHELWEFGKSCLLSLPVSVCASRREEFVSLAVLDEDVIAENERVAAGVLNSGLIVIDQLSEVYGNDKVAVGIVTICPRSVFA